jgi:hypothetical protein
MAQGAREGRHLLTGLIRLTQEAARTRQWGRTSAEFVAAALAVLGLPVGLVRARRVLKARIALDLAPNRADATS